MESLPSNLAQVCLNTQPATFLDLPPELLQRICDHFTWPTLLNLRLASPRIATTTLCYTELARRYQRCKDETLKLEHELSRGLSVSDVGWPTGNLVSANDTLPCYRCLCWKPGADRALKTSAFTRVQSTGKCDFGNVNAALRICIDCGIRTGRYGRGCRVGYWMMCRNCNVRLSKESCGTRVTPKNPAADWKEFKYCQECIRNGGLPDSLLQWQHEMNWSRYERGMREGKLYRITNGERLRREKGVTDRATEATCEVDGTKSWTFCPLRNKMGLCTCQRSCKHSLYREPY